MLSEREKVEEKDVKTEVEEKLEPAIIKVEEEHAQRVLEEPVQLI